MQVKGHIIMTAKNVYSRAYHCEMYKCKIKVKARAVAQEAVRLWKLQEGLL